MALKQGIENEVYYNLGNSVSVACDLSLWNLWANAERNPWRRRQVLHGAVRNMICHYNQADIFRNLR